ADAGGENMVPVRSHSAAAVTGGTTGTTAPDGGLRAPADNTADHRTSLALDSLTSELDALRSHWEATNRRNYRLSTNTLDPDREDFGFGRGGAMGEEGDGAKEEGLLLSESLVGWRRKLEEEEARARVAGGEGEDKEAEKSRGGSSSSGAATPVASTAGNLTAGAAPSSPRPPRSPAEQHDGRGSAGQAPGSGSPVMPVSVTVTADNMI
ncbi:Negative regulator of mitotic exit, partial [Ascosphaera atra]